MEKILFPWRPSAKPPYLWRKWNSSVSLNGEVGVHLATLSSHKKIIHVSNNIIKMMTWSFETNSTCYLCFNIIKLLAVLERTCPKGQLVSLLQPVTQTPLPPRRFPLLDGPLFELLLGLENVITNWIQDPQFPSYFLIIKDNYVLHKSKYDHVIKDHYISDRTCLRRPSSRRTPRRGSARRRSRSWRRRPPRSARPARTACAARTAAGRSRARSCAPADTRFLGDTRDFLKRGCPTGFDPEMSISLYFRVYHKSHSIRDKS